MSLVKCPECVGNVSDKAAACPHCGYPLPIGGITWQELANNPALKISAIKAYRELHGVPLAEAKTAVEHYIEGKSN